MTLMPFAPFRPWPAHVMKLGPVRVEQFIHKLPQGTCNDHRTPRLGRCPNGHGYRICI
jgi:hypothetical protein